MLKILHLFLLTTLFFELSLVKVYSKTYLYDHFSDSSLNNWKVYSNSGTVTVKQSSLILESNSDGFPYLYGKFNPFPVKDESTTLDVRFRYSKFGYMGNGLSVGFTGETLYPYYQMSFWQDKNTVFSYNDFNKQNYNYCKPYETGENKNDRINTSIGIDNGWHILTIEFHPNTDWYSVYLDRSVASIPIYSSRLNQCIPPVFMVGNPLGGGGNDWSSLEVDFVRLYTTGEEPILQTDPTGTPIPSLTPTPIVTPTSTPTPTFTPTPTPTPRKKVIIIPGMGASWNSEALVYNKLVEDNKWKMTPFVKNYDLLIGSLRVNGYELDKDYFVWNYDWRQPISESVKKFGEYFDSKILPDDKATVVGHSMGGVIGRIWLQGILNDKRVEKVVSLGSPQSGAMDPYTLWNGGKVAVKDSVSSIALNILLQLHKDKFQTNADVIKNFVPSTRDLVPVYNFLSLGKNTIPYSAISFPNNYLMQTNSEVIGLTSKYFAVVGIGDSTPSWLTLEKRNWYDRLFNIWPDGRPKLTMFANGDGTVLRESQSVGGVSTSEYISNHGDIVNDSIPIVLSMIGVGKTIPKPNFDLEGSSVYYIGSPVVVEASCQTGDFVSDESGFLVIDKDSGNCKIGLRGTDDGTYHLVAGTVGGDSWKYFEGEIKKDEKIGVKEKEFNNKFILEIIKRDLNKLGLGGLEKQVNKNNLMAVLKGVVDYRRKYDEIPITERLIDNLLSIIKFEHVIKSPVSTINGYSNFGKINKSTALSMQKAESLMSSLKTYKSDWSKSMVTLTEAWVLLGGR